MSDYEKFQLQWMIDHGHSLRELLEELERVQYDDPENDAHISTPVTELFVEWERDRGFGSEIWPCEAEYESREAVERCLYVCLVDEIRRFFGDIPFGVEI